MVLGDRYFWIYYDEAFEFIDEVPGLTTGAGAQPLVFADRMVVAGTANPNVTGGGISFLFVQYDDGSVVPLQEYPAGMPIPEELREGSGRPRVLVVDDEASIREVLTEHLTTREKPYEVMAAADGFEAGRLVATFKPDVVLLDLRMPGMDGFQVCRTVKADPETSNTVVIAMTGYYTPETEARILECGAMRCIAKPIEPSALGTQIDQLFDLGTGPRQRRRRHPAKA